MASVAGFSPGHEAEEAVNMGIHWLGIALLLAFSALFSGLTLGLMGLDVMALQVIQGSGRPLDRERASKILPVRRLGNRLLCTLLIGNVFVNAGITNLLSGAASGPVAVAVSTALIVVFGEIIPQAVCSRHALLFGSYSIGLVRILIWLLIPITYPMARVLDLVLGRELGTVFSRNELMRLLDLHANLPEQTDITARDAQYMTGALSLPSKTAAEVMTPLVDVFALPVDAVLNSTTLESVVDSGFTRVPVHEKEDKGRIVGLVRLRDLVLLSPRDELPVRALLAAARREPVLRVGSDTRLDECLERFRSEMQHLALVETPDGAVVGLVTMEDVIEELLQQEIVDETDVYLDNRTRQPVAGRERQSALAGVFTSAREPHAAPSPQLLQAVAAFLHQTVAAFQNLSMPALEGLLKRRATWVEVPVDEALYTRGRAAEMFTLVVAGRVRVSAADGAVLEQGPFSVLGEQALEGGGRDFVPEFSAVSLGTSVMFISGGDYEEGRRAAAEANLRWPEETVAREDIADSQDGEGEAVPLLAFP